MSLTTPSGLATRYLSAKKRRSVHLCQKAKPADKDLLSRRGSPGRRLTDPYEEEPFSKSRTLVSSPSVVKGFCRNATPGSSTPWWAMPFSV